MIAILFWLFVAHAFGDYVFQTDVMSREKRRSSETHLQTIVPWYYWLSAHALVHGGLVALATGSVLIGIFETVAHAFIDFGKCEGWYGMAFDQILHVLCKFMWLALILAYAN